MGGNDLLWRKAALLTDTADARAENEDGLPGDDRQYQTGDKLHGIAAIAIEKDQNFRILPHRGYTGLDGAPVAAPRLDNDAGTSRGSLIDRSVLRAAIHHNDFAHILRKHSRHDPCNRRLLVEAWNDRGDNGRAMGGRLRRVALVRDVVHRLQRSPQLAQASGGRSESRAFRNSR